MSGNVRSFAFNLAVIYIVYANEEIIFFIGLTGYLAHVDMCFNL